MQSEWSKAGRCGFGSDHAVFRPLVETIEVVTIGAAWDPPRRKDVVPSIVEIAVGAAWREHRHPSLNKV